MNNYGDYTLRYKTYLSVEKEPTNWGFMHFINDMRVKYAEHLGYKGDMLFFNIKNHDDFDRFIIDVNKEVS